MSTRVFNPVVMELQRAMRATSSDAGLFGAAAAAAAAAAVAATATASSAEPTALTRVCRNLFGPVDHDENKRFVERELAAQSARDSDLYEFDFEKGQPRAGPARRFLWERVRPGMVPETYALRSLAFLSAEAKAATATTTTATTVATTSTATTTTSPTQPASEPASQRQSDSKQAQRQPPCTPAPRKVRQVHIHEYMRACKRPSSSSETKKSATDTSSTNPSPSKRARLVGDRS